MSISRGPTKNDQMAAKRYAKKKAQASHIATFPSPEMSGVSHEDLEWHDYIMVHGTPEHLYGIDPQTRYFPVLHGLSRAQDVRRMLAERGVSVTLVPSISQRAKQIIPTRSTGFLLLFEKDVAHFLDDFPTTGRCMY